MSYANVGKKIRMSRLFDPKSGRCVVVAMDHGIEGAPAGLENVGRVLDRLLVEKLDGLLMNAGMFRHFSDKCGGKGSPAIILTGDIYVNSTLPGGEYIGEEYRRQISMAHLAASGADCVKVFLIFGQQGLCAHADNMAILSQIVDEASDFGMPVMVEPVHWGPGSEEYNRQDGFLADVCRIAVEAGADIIKAPYVPQVETLRRVVANCPIPVLILGGSKVANLKDLFAMAANAMEAGVQGLVFGRNIWQQEDPSRFLHCLNLIVHQGRSYESAMEEAEIAQQPPH